MKGQSVLALIVVLVCFCLSFARGHDDIGYATQCLRTYYIQLIVRMEHPNTPRSGRTVYRHIREVNDEQKSWQDWLREILGYSLETLSNPQGSFKSEDERKLATEFHLWLSAWYYVRFVSLAKAAENDSYEDNGYPRIDLCRDAALKAFKHYKHHKSLYTQFYQALDDRAQQSITKKLDFPTCLDSKELKHQYVKNDAISSVRSHLKALIKRFSRRKTSINSSSLNKMSSIKTFLAPSRMTPKESLMSKVRDLFPVEDFSLPPDKASRSDGEFVEMAWLLNQYRSLWYETRHNEFRKFLQNWRPCQTGVCIKRVKGGKKDAKKLSRHYQSLSSDYYKHFQKYKPDRLVILEDYPSASKSMDVRQIHLPEDGGLEQIRWRGKRKRTTLRQIRNIGSARTHEAAEHQSSNEDLENVNLNSQEFCARTASRSQPDFDLNIAQPELDLNIEDLCLADALLQLHTNYGLRANINNQRAQGMIEMDTVAPKRIKVTRSEENHSRASPNLSSVRQSTSEMCNSESSRTVENSYSSSKIQHFALLNHDDLF